ncbi:hypothetical protein ACVW0W_001357 [Bradyrhizobium sp. USDA 4469]
MFESGHPAPGLHGNPFKSDLPSNNRSGDAARRQGIYSPQRRVTFR